MGWKYQVGKAADEAVQQLLRWRVPGSQFFPPGQVFSFDVARLYAFERRPGPRVIVDVGANVGDVVLHLRRWFPGAAIHAIEPISSTFRTLQERTRHDAAIACHQLALGAAPERREIILRENSELNTLVNDPSIPHAATGMRETITIDTLDAFCARERLTSIDLLKLDVQGFEDAVIAGAETMLPRTRFLFAEAGFRPELPDLATFDRLFQSLYPRGFFVCGFYNPLRHDDCKLLMSFCNVLFLNKRWIAPA